MHHMQPSAPMNLLLYVYEYVYTYMYSICIQTYVKCMYKLINTMYICET